MSKSALIKNGIVTNVIEGILPDYISCPNNTGINWLYDEVDFVSPPPPPVTSDRVNSERDRRAKLDFIFNGNSYQSKSDDVINILGAVSNAQSAMLSGGGLANDYRWHGGIKDFSWITSDNNVVIMDAPTVLAFGAAAANHKEKAIVSARALKDMVDNNGDPFIPTDFDTNETYWS